MNRENEVKVNKSCVTYIKIIKYFHTPNIFDLLHKVLEKILHIILEKKTKLKNSTLTTES